MTNYLPVASCLLPAENYFMLHALCATCPERLDLSSSTGLVEGWPMRRNWMLLMWHIRSIGGSFCEVVWIDMWFLQGSGLDLTSLLDFVPGLIIAGCKLRDEIQIFQIFNCTHSDTPIIVKLSENLTFRPHPCFQLLTYRFLFVNIPYNILLIGNDCRDFLQISQLLLMILN